MSIERSGVAASTKSVAGAESQSGKGKVKSAGEAKVPAAGEFFALLASFEPVAEQVESVDAPLTADERPQATALPFSEVSMAPVPNLPTALAILLEQAGRVVGDKLSTASDERPPGTTSAIRLADPATSTVKTEVPLAASVSLGDESAENFKQKVDELLDETAQGLPVQTHKIRGAELQSAAGASLAESRALKLASLTDVSTKESALSGALVTSGVVDGFARQADRAVAKSSALPSAYGIEGPWGQHASVQGSRVDAPAAMADPSSVSLESMVADTVSYWVTQGVQHAELKLDGFGGESVEVSISLKGDEAHIGFRTDQPEIRQVLEGAVAHLKDILTSEGLVLAGVSVGTSGQDGAGTQERRNRPGDRQATVKTMEAVPTESHQRVHSSVGRSVDLFV